MDNKLIKIPLPMFTKFLQETLTYKFDTSLQDLKKRFAKFFNIGKQVMQLLVSLSDLIDQDGLNQSEDDYVDPKQIIHTALNIIQGFFTEYPEFLANRYCVYFQYQTQESFMQIKQLLHSLTHIHIDKRSIQGKFQNKLKQVQDGFRMMQAVVPEISEEIRIQQNVLNHKDEILTNLQQKIEGIQVRFRRLQLDPLFLQFYTIYHFMHHPAKKHQSKITNIQAFFAQLTKAINLHYKLSIMLKGPQEFALTVNQNGKKGLKGQSAEIQLAVKYSIILSKADFSLRSLNKMNVEEFVETMKFLDKQRLLNNFPYMEDGFNSVEFKLTLDQWDSLNNEIVMASTKNSVINEWENERNKNHLISMDIRQFVSQLQDFQEYMIDYSKICIDFERIHHEIRETFHRKLNMKVEVECPDLNNSIIV